MKECGNPEHATAQPRDLTPNDIDARAYAEELRRSEERFRALIEHSAEVFMILGPDGTIHYRSPTRTGIGHHGYRIEEIVGKNAFDFVHPEDQPRMRAFLADVVRRPGPSPQTYCRTQAFDGSIRTMEIMVNNQLANPAIAGIIYKGRDVTEQKQTEEALRALNETLEQRVAERTSALQESEERFRLVTEAVTDAIYDWNLLTKEMWRSQGYLQLLHPPALREQRNGWWESHLHPDDRERVITSLRAALDGPDRVWRCEYRFQRDDGVEMDLADRALIARDSKGVPTRLVGSMADITHRKEVDRVKDALLSTVGHELRTPLTSMRGFTELLLIRDFAPEQQRKMLSIMHQESLRLTTLIDNLLDLKRIDAGRHPYVFEPLDITPLLPEAIAVFSTNHAMHPMRTVVRSPLPLVQADANGIRQVLRNLLSNAIKYSPTGGMVMLGAHHEGEEVVVWIADRGIGIPPEALPKLFTKFFRVDNASTRAIGGTGLGLALVKEIINAHHGRVWVDSTEGKGSTFFFTLPVATG
jgi:PAS domain S-box-containing protein